jgi:hypothetical protein
MIFDVHQMTNEGVGNMSQRWRRPYRRAGNVTDVTLNLQTPWPVQTLTPTVCTQLYFIQKYSTERRRLASPFPS